MFISLLTIQHFLKIVQTNTVMTDFLQIIWAYWT